MATGAANRTSPHAGRDPRLPAIPTVLLYGGLGRHQVGAVCGAAQACERTWEQRALAVTSPGLRPLFQDVLSQFDTRSPDGFPLAQRGQLVGQMAERCWKRTTTR